jgi:hypothetical protein
MARKPCPTLPAELWGCICHYTDDFTLWMVYRYISLTLRSEAEREFAHTRLPNLDLTWSCVGDLTYKDREYSFISDSRQRAAPSRFIHIVDKRAHFSINSVHVEKAKDDEESSRDMELGYLMTRRAELALQNIDTNFKSCEGIGRPTFATAILGDFVNNNSIPGFEMDYTSQEFSFEWKPFFTTFFTDYLHVAKTQDPANPYATVLRRTERAERNLDNTLLCERKLWPHDYGSLEDKLFEKAYLKRSRKAHETMGLRFVLGVKDLDALRVEVQRVRNARNGVVWKRSVERRRPQVYFMG